MTTSVLTIDSLLPENAGNLECAMDLGSKTVRSKPCALVVVGIEQPPTSSDFLIGETGKLFCIATGWFLVQILMFLTLSLGHPIQIDFSLMMLLSVDGRFS